MVGASEFPEIGDAVPRRWSRAVRWLAGRVLRVLGWRVVGPFPNLSKGIFVVAPHTTNWDFVVGILMVFALGLRASFLGKHPLFKWPLRAFMVWMGGIPVDRRTASGVVGQVVELFDSSDSLLLGLSPEGTRKPVDRWRTGFYHVAHGAKVPIVPASIDYGRKMIRFGAPLEATGELAADLHKLASFFNDVTDHKGWPALDEAASRAPS